MDMALVKALVGSLTLTLFDELRLSFPLLQDGPSRKEALCCYLYDSISLEGDIIGLAIRDDVCFDFGASFPIDPVAVIEDLYSNCPTPARALRFHKIRILFPLKSGHEAGNRLRDLSKYIEGVRCEIELALHTTHNKHRIEVIALLYGPRETNNRWPCDDLMPIEVRFGHVPNKISSSQVVPQQRQ
ncbi:hypothetical protein E6O75_ATG02592 [Venturia nashicola]|uniref:Uncharacterized protein n=1 Tax=Venturia nashicola TaxID=86259 RepID=A0A4Z1P5K4_9PEZI|nr:hypothetical protein E6O75_ATG02592 [Venturia nashicola]